MAENAKERKYSGFCIFVGVICAVTNTSQLPTFVDSGVTQYLSMPAWALLAAVCLMKGTSIRIRDAMWVIKAGVAFMLYYLMALLLGAKQGSALPYPIFLSLFIFTIGLLVGRGMTVSEIKLITSFYAISALLVGLEVFFKYIVAADLNNIVYAYDSKNSISQILLTALIIFLLYWIPSKNYAQRIFGWIAFSMLLSTLVGLKSRATLIALPLLFVWLIKGASIPKTVKRAVSACIVILTVVLLIGDNFDKLVDSIIFANRDSSDINSISSGRAEQWERFPKEFMEAPLFGGGANARESLILTALLEFGVIGGGVVFVLAASPLLWGLKSMNKNHELYALLIAVAFSYLINGFFEQMAPFGPGVKCYYLWFLFGILAGHPMEDAERVTEINVRQRIPTD